MFGGDAAFEAQARRAVHRALDPARATRRPTSPGWSANMRTATSRTSTSPISTPMPARRGRRRRWSAGCCTEMYKAEPDGVIGNDDCGQMSAWFVLSALGFYPVDPVSAIYVFGSPLFDTAEVEVGKGAQRCASRAIGNAPDRALCPVGALERPALDARTGSRTPTWSRAASWSSRWAPRRRASARRSRTGRRRSGAGRGRGLPHDRVARHAGFVPATCRATNSTPSGSG